MGVNLYGLSPKQIQALLLLRSRRRLSNGQGVSTRTIRSLADRGLAEVRELGVVHGPPDHVVWAAVPINEHLWGTTDVRWDRHRSAR